LSKKEIIKAIEDTLNVIEKINDNMIRIALKVEDLEMRLKLLEGNN